MANLQALYKALEKADAAGNKEDARGIASIIKAETLNAKALELAPPAVEQPKPEEVGFLDRAGESLKQGFEAFGGASRGRELASLKEEGKLPQAAAKMEEIQTKAAEQRTPTLSPSDINRIAHEKGLWPAGKEVPSFIVEQVLKSGPEMAVPVLTGLLASAGTAAVTGPAAPVAAPVVGFLAGTAAYGYQQYGHFMERQALEKEAPEELNPTQAKQWAAITAPVGFFIDKVGLGVSKFGAKAVGETAVKELARRKAAGEIGAATVAKEVAKAGTKQAGVAAVTEAPTEVLEQMAERYQADLPLWNEEAKQEYYDAAWSAAAAGVGLGGVSGSYSQYRNYKKAQEEIKPVDEVEQVKPGKEKLGRAETIKALAKDLEAKGAKLAEERTAKEEAQAKATAEAEAVKLAEQGVPPEQAAQAVVTEQAPPAEVEPAAPGVLNETTLTSLGLNKRSNAYKELLGVDLNTPQGLQFFEETLDSHTGRINEPAVAELVKSLTPVEIENVVEQPADRTGVAVSEQQGLSDAERTGEPIGSAVVGAGTDAGDVSAREVPKPASLENVQVGDEVAIGDKTYRKTDTGFELVESAGPSEEAAVETAPVAEEVIAEPEAVEAPPVEEITPIEKRGRALAKELRALDPEHPLVDDLTAFDVNEETLALAQQNIDELKAQREQRAPTTEGELRELSEDQVIAEGEPVVQAVEIDTDKYLNDTKAELGEVVRRVFPVTENIVPEEKASIGDLLKAIANYMHALIQKGVRSMGEAIKMTRSVLGADADKVNPKQYKKAYSEAVKRPKKGGAKATEQDYDEQLKRTGTKQNKPPKTAAPQVSANKAITDLTRKLRSGFFSFDLAINKKIMDAMRSAGVSADSLARAFYDLQVTQAVKADSIADSFLERGKISFDPNIFKFIVTEAAASMRNIRVTLDTLAKQKGLDAEKFRTYASAAFIAKRTKGLIKANTRLKQKALALYAQGKKAQAEKLLKKHYKLIHMSPSEIKAAEKFFTDFPELNGVFDMWNEVRENVLDFATEQGLYDEETRDDLLNIMDYVPFYRVEQLEAKAGPKEYSRGLLDTAADKAFKGSHQEVNDVFDNMERWARYMVMKSIKNAAAQNKIKYYAKYLPNDVKVIAKGERSQTGNTVSVWHNGKLKRYEFQGNDGETMVDGFTGLEPVIVNGSGLLLGALRKTAAFQRLNIVLNPIFSIAQIPQDMFSAMVSSGIKYPLALPLQVVKEIVLSPVGLSKSRKELKKTVTVGKHDYRNEFQRMDKTAEEEIKALKTFDKILKAAMSPFSALSMASDNVIRQAVYSQIMLETGDAARAAHSAEEIIHFRRTGSYGFVNLVRQYVPFVNANLQALHVTASTIVGDGINHATRGEAMQRFMVQGAQLIAASLLYTAMKSDDDDYKKLDPTERDRFLIINKDYKLPMRNDLFTWLFKIVPEHIFNRYVAESEDSTKLRKALKEGLIKALATPSALPTLATPFVEAKYNINTVTGRPLVGQGQEGLEAELQYSPKYTTELSKLIGEGTDISPTIIDNFLRDYFGATGMVLAMATNSLAAEKRGVVLPTKTDKEEYMQYPFFSSFLVKEYGSRNMADYYELNEVVNRVVQSYNKKNGFDYDMAQDYLNKDKNRDIVIISKEVQRLGKHLNQIRAYENKILEDRKNNWTPDEKAEQLKQLEEERQNVLGFQLELEDRSDRYVQQLRRKAGL